MSLCIQLYFLRADELEKSSMLEVGEVCIICKITHASLMHDLTKHAEVRARHSQVYLPLVMHRMTVFDMLIVHMCD